MQQFLLIKMGKELYGLDIMKVKSIEQNLKISPATCLGDKWVGMINLRDEVIKIANGKHKLNYLISENQMNQNNIVIIQAENEKYGLIVDEACSIYEVESEEELVEMPTVIKSDYFDGILKYNTDLVSLINIEKLVA